MIPLRSRRSFLSTMSLSVLSAGLSGCGTFLYPERRGQPGGRIDWKVVALDGIGLLLFFVPGVIAFAVDIYSGAIYLPPDEYSGTDQPTLHEGFVSIPLPEERRDTRAIEAAIAANTGKQIRLDDERCHRTRLPALAQFNTLTERLKEQCGLG